MKLHTEEKNLERGGTQAETTFTIKTTAKAFDILSSGLYSDPKTAIIRELSCNAYDSHVAAGKADVPFRIHLPNRLEPFLSIRDYGTGLSDKDVLGLYTTYFESTKTDSNDYIGALGLGSKSPFSYSSAFEVSSFFNGKKMMYSIFLNESGIPSVARMGETDTDEENGLEIRITVESDDFYSFRDRTAEVLKYFPTKPTVVGSSGFEFNSLPENTITGTGWFVAPKTWSSRRFVAVQGNVPYRVDMSKIKELLTDEENRFFENAQIVAFFEIGDLEVAASREEIRYDDRSKEALVEKAREIRADLTGVIERDIGKLDPKKVWDAYIQLDEYSSKTFGNSQSLRKFLIADKITNPILESYIANDRKVKQIPADDIKHWHFDTYSRPRYTYSMTMSRTSTSVPLWLIPDPDIVFVVADERKGAIKRTANWVNKLKESRPRSIIMIKPKEYKVTSSAKTRELNKLLNNYGNPPIKKVSEMENVSIQRTGSVPALQVFLQPDGCTNSGYYGNKRYKWTEYKSDDSKAPTEGFYFFCSRGKTPHFGEDTDSDKWADRHLTPGRYQNELIEMINVINWARGTQYTVKDVYGLPVNTLKQVRKNKKWENIFDATRSALKKMKKEVDFYCRWKDTPDELGFKGLIGFEDFCDQVCKLDKDSTFRTVLEPIMEEYAKYGDKLNRAQTAFEVDVKLHGFDNRVYPKSGKTFLKSGAFDEYPMLTFVDTIRYDASINVLFDYIQLVDRS